jgi:two-component system, cell cycle sensor histidine kinase and response regulator CckA
MNAPLRILHIEDDPNDAALIQACLEAEGICCATERVETRQSFLAALERREFDLILSDFALPTFDGMSAIRIVRDKHPDVPVILVSGTVGEDEAIDSMKSGATDYVLKGRLGRLGPAVVRAMQEVGAAHERQRLKAQIIESQKMEIIGQLAGGVAHDFNNILGVIIGYNDLMIPELDPKGLAYKCAYEIRHAAERAAGLTRQLLVFSRKQTVQPIVLNLSNNVEAMSAMLRRLIGENIAMTILPCSACGHIQADPGYIGQVLMNLVVNARDAMPDGGQLTLAVENITLDEAYAQAHYGEKAGEFVLLSIHDTGTGMTDEVKAHLFETFFTTKPVGKGTGLGLATCQSIVQQCKGHIRVRSEVGKGSTFSVYFPRTDQPVDRTAAETINSSFLEGGAETLLIVEDEPSLRDLAVCVLEGKGYNVLSAANGMEALRRAREHKGAPIRLVITDVIMPLMDGKVMADKLTADYPEVKVLFTSGYTDDAIAHHGVLDAGVELLTKPYTTAALAARVRDILDGLPTPRTQPRAVFAAV